MLPMRIPKGEYEARVRESISRLKKQGYAQGIECARCGIITPISVRTVEAQVYDLERAIVHARDCLVKETHP